MTAALIKRVLYLIATVLAVAIVFLGYYLPQGVWLLVSALLFLNISLDTTLLRRTMIITAAGAVSVCMVFIGTLIAPFVVAQVILLSMITGYCVYMGVMRGRTAYPWFIVNFLGVLSINTNGTLAAALSHAQATLISVLIVVAAQFILLPYFTRDEYRRARVKSYNELRKLMADIFNCLLVPEYTDNVYLFERRIHKAKINSLKEIAIFAQREAVARPHEHHAGELQVLFQLIIDIGQIRRRVTDHTIFALCRDDLQDVYIAISKLLDAFGARSETRILIGYLEQLESTILNFENNFENVLRVTAREPLVFVLMMNALQAFAGQCRRMAGMASQQVEVQA